MKNSACSNPEIAAKKDWYKIGFYSTYLAPYIHEINESSKLRPPSPPRKKKTQGYETDCITVCYLRCNSGSSFFRLGGMVVMRHLTVASEELISNPVSLVSMVNTGGSKEILHLHVLYF